MSVFFWVTGVAALVVSALLLVASYRESAAAHARRSDELAARAARRMSACPTCDDRDAWRRIARKWGGE